MTSACGYEGICVDDTQSFDGTRFYDGYVPTLRSSRSGLKVIVGAAMRGRYTKGDGKTEQHVEINEEGICNALTTVQKDSLILEVKL